MTETYDLAAEKREATKHSARDTRSAGRVPGVVYGHGVDPQPVSVDYSEFLKLFRRAGQASLVNLDISGKKTKVLIHTYDLDPVRDTFDHVDFLAVNLKEKAMVTVPLVFTGESLAVKNLGGIFMSSHDSIEIRCLPTEIPHDIQVDISALADLHDHITIADLNLPENLEVMHMDIDTVICSITGRASATEEEETEATTEATEEGGEESTEEASE